MENSESKSLNRTIMLCMVASYVEVIKYLSSLIDDLSKVVEEIS